METDSDISRFGPTATVAALQFRAAMLRRVRRFFDQRHFLEVETPILSRDTVVDLHLDPLVTNLHVPTRDQAGGISLYLQTSPEFHMKRLLASGFPSIFQVAKAFRDGESGRYHNPEFTMIEWYRLDDTMELAIELLGEFACASLGVETFDTLSYRDAFRQFAAVDPFEISNADLAEAVRSTVVDVPESIDGHDRESWLDILLTEVVEPVLGGDRPLILYDYPASQAALAQVREDVFPVAERFELYFRGIELANGYHELLDGEVLKSRNEQVNKERMAMGKPPLPGESRMLDAMRNGLPHCSGVALGFDRLVMLAMGASSIDQVMSFPISNA